MTNIALVDDESNILTSVSLALETEGYVVDTFNNGEEALSGLESKKYDPSLVKKERDFLRTCLSFFQPL